MKINYEHFLRVALSESEVQTEDRHYTWWS